VPTYFTPDEIQYPGIRVFSDHQRDMTFHLTVRELLAKIANQPVGQSLLYLLGNTRPFKSPDGGHNVVIMRDRRGGREPGVDLRTRDPAHNSGNRCIRGNPQDNAFNGTGTYSTVTVNPNLTVVPHGPRPPYIALAHELIHALHNLEGDAERHEPDEENKTVGIAKSEYIWGDITENMIRIEHGLDLRTAY